jgi:hypothetical protein
MEDVRAFVVLSFDFTTTLTAILSWWKVKLGELMQKERMD